jgi:hypothetical protein
MRNRRLHWALTVFLSFAITVPAFTWGDEGHRIVARIAARHLTPQARARIAAVIRAVPTNQDDLQLRDLVGVSGTPSTAQIENILTTIATWPDHMPGGKKETAPWHFIDIGLFEGPGHMNERCPSGCVNQKITEVFQGLKANKPLTRFPPDRELRFLVHFLGDIHQPLHAATNADAGANCVKAEGLEPSHELHAVWDTALVELVIEGSEADAASAIIQSLNNRRAEFQALLDPNQIAVESFGLARAVAYGKAKPAVPVINRFINVSPSLCKKQAPFEINAITVDAKGSYDNQPTLDLIRQQLYKGGVRLAALLNSL